MKTISVEQFATDIIGNLKTLPIRLTKAGVQIGTVEELNKDHFRASFENPIEESIISRYYLVKSKKPLKVKGKTFDYYMTRDLKPTAGQLIEVKP